MLTKDDLMKLPKERLCELLLEEWEDIPNNRFVSAEMINGNFTPCYAPNGTCTNPFHDCINCPKQFSGNGTTISTDGTNLQPLNK